MEPFDITYQRTFKSIAAVANGAFLGDNSDVEANSGMLGVNFVQNTVRRTFKA